MNEAVREFDGFEWDSGNQGKCQKHGVSLAEIEAVIRVPLAVMDDPAHSASEQRFRAVGRAGRRHVFAVFTVRVVGTRTLIRPISARYMHAKEVRAYEETVPEV